MKVEDKIQMWETLDEQYLVLRIGEGQVIFGDDRELEYIIELCQWYLNRGRERNEASEDEPSPFG